MALLKECRSAGNNLPNPLSWPQSDIILVLNHRPLRTDMLDGGVYTFDKWPHLRWILGKRFLKFRRLIAQEDSGIQVLSRMFVLIGIDLLVCHATFDSH
ncbi:hypothetical protein JTE90_005077 [Oedothorax gibbosus]|uniref:Uncharacterized protein n=1 Tax=Oedothorax gibbosus TaxID=931172 RepID=A0AAV6VAX6_9ARAC|nr:hypothetical protein JTE90_005077 [Oedothorax gibbosus]